jgi:hypothetical protein
VLKSEYSLSDGHVVGGGHVKVERVVSGVVEISSPVVSNSFHFDCKKDIGMWEELILPI